MTTAGFSESKETFSTEPHLFIERVMEDLGVKWTIRTVTVPEVDIRDNTYQTRLNVSAATMTVAREYADKMADGDTFPMIVLQEKSPGRFRVVCGRTRACGYDIAKNGKCSYRAYVVAEGTSAELLVALSARENNGNGVRQSSADTARVAADWLMRTPTPPGGTHHGRTVVNAAAARFGAKGKTVDDHYKVKLVEVAMLRVGVEPPPGAPLVVLRGVFKWAHADGWKEVAEAVACHCHVPKLSKEISKAAQDKVDAATLVRRIEEAANSSSCQAQAPRFVKDPATVTMEHLSFALRDLRDLAPARNLPEEQADEIASLVEAVRVACKEWKHR